MFSETITFTFWQLLLYVAAVGILGEIFSWVLMKIYKKFKK